MARKDKLRMLCDEFSNAMYTKLAKKRRAGYRGWDEIAAGDLQERLIQHAVRALGDPKQWVDVANFAAFLWQREAREAERPEDATEPAEGGE